MTRTEWTRLEAAFQRLRRLPPDRREPRLVKLARADARLADDLRRLLLRHEEDHPLDVPALALAPGTRLGGFVISRLLARGGMGAVYLAEQVMPQRHVALKILDVAVQRESERARFRSEVEALVRLRHPAIAQVYAAGESEPAPGLGPRPWFAMELVEGARTITDFARQTRASWRASVQSVAQVCAAVHHCHLRGVVHRDLKPGNILIDRGGHPKVIDFGIARLSGGRGRATRTQGMLGTLAYMSPEQLSGSRDIDARTDVYSLGVVLAEMLTGRLPYATAPEQPATWIRAVLEDEPELPSRRNRRLDRDLDWVVHTALEKSPQRRYASIASLGEDLERVLRRLPVRARPPTARYRVQRFVARHRLLVSAATVAVIGAAAGVAGLMHGISSAEAAAAASAAAAAASEAAAAEVRQQERGLEVVLEKQGSLLAELAVRATDPEQRLAGTLRDWGSTVSNASDAPAEAKARMLFELGHSFLDLGQPDLAAPQLAAALSLAGDDAMRVAIETMQLRVRLFHARLTASCDVTADAEQVEAVLARAKACGAEVEGWCIELDGLAGSLAAVRGDHATALARLQGAVDAAQRVDVGAKRRASLVQELALAHFLAGDAASAIPLQREALAMREEAFAKEHPFVLESRVVLAVFLEGARDHAAARALYEETVPALRKTCGDTHPVTLNARNNHCRFLLSHGSLQAALPAIDELLADMTRLRGEKHAATAGVMGVRMRCLEQLGRTEQAIAYGPPVHALLAETVGPTHDETLLVAAALGRALMQGGQLEEAERWFTTVCDMLMQSGRGSSHAMASTLLSRHYARARRGEQLAAYRDLTASARIVEAVLGPGHPDTVRTKELVGRAKQWLVGHGLTPPDDESK
jgi:tetratricopeptide (TPR) repeat protein